MGAFVLEGTMKIVNLRNLPIFVIASDSDIGGALGAYKSVINALYIYSGTLNRNDFLEFLKEQENPGSINRLSTIVHELFHWGDAKEYIEKHGKITNQEEYINGLCKEHKAIVERLKFQGYYINSISDYAAKQMKLGRYDEVFTEYRTKILLKG